MRDKDCKNIVSRCGGPEYFENAIKIIKANANESMEHLSNAIIYELLSPCKVEDLREATLHVIAEIHHTSNKDPSFITEEILNCIQIFLGSKNEEFNKDFVEGICHFNNWRHSFKYVVFIENALKYVNILKKLFHELLDKSGKLTKKHVHAFICIRKMLYDEKTFNNAIEWMKHFGIDIFKLFVSKVPVTINDIQDKSPWNALVKEFAERLHNLYSAGSIDGFTTCITAFFDKCQNEWLRGATMELIYCTHLLLSNVEDSDSSLVIFQIFYRLNIFLKEKSKDLENYILSAPVPQNLWKKSSKIAFLQKRASCFPILKKLYFFNLIKSENSKNLIIENVRELLNTENSVNNGIQKCLLFRLNLEQLKMKNEANKGDKGEEVVNELIKQIEKLNLEESKPFLSKFYKACVPEGYSSEERKELRKTLKNGKSRKIRKKERLAQESTISEVYSNCTDTATSKSCKTGKEKEEKIENSFAPKSETEKSFFKNGKDGKNQLALTKPDANNTFSSDESSKSSSNKNRKIVALESTINKTPSNSTKNVNNVSSKSSKNGSKEKNGNSSAQKSNIKQSFSKGYKNEENPLASTSDANKASSNVEKSATEKFESSEVSSDTEKNADAVTLKSSKNGKKEKNGNSSAQKSDIEKTCATNSASSSDEKKKENGNHVKSGILKDSSNGEKNDNATNSKSFNGKESFNDAQEETKENQKPKSLKSENDKPREKKLSEAKSLRDITMKLITKINSKEKVFYVLKQFYDVSQKNYKDVKDAVSNKSWIGAWEVSMKDERIRNLEAHAPVELLFQISNPENEKRRKIIHDEVREMFSKNETYKLAIKWISKFDIKGIQEEQFGHVTTFKWIFQDGIQAILSNNYTHEQKLHYLKLSDDILKKTRNDVLPAEQKYFAVVEMLKQVCKLADKCGIDIKKENLYAFQEKYIQEIEIKYRFYDRDYFELFAVQDLEKRDEKYNKWFIQGIPDEEYAFRWAKYFGISDHEMPKRLKSCTVSNINVEEFTEKIQKIKAAVDDKIHVKTDNTEDCKIWKRPYKVITVLTPKAFNDFVHKYFVESKPKLVGIDVESGANDEAAVLQLATDEWACLIHINKLCEDIPNKEWEDFFSTLMAPLFDPKIVRIGFEFRSDYNFLLRKLPFLQKLFEDPKRKVLCLQKVTKYIIDQEIVVKCFCYDIPKKFGLAKLAKTLLNIDMDKSEQIGKWASEFLTQFQKIYAVGDAIIVVLIKNKMEEFFAKEFSAEKVNEIMNSGYICYEPKPDVTDKQE